MKKLQIIETVLAVVFYLHCSCSNQSQIKINENLLLDDRIDSTLENIVINQTINSLLDSIHDHIMLNLHNDTTLYTAIYYHDTLLAQRYIYPEYQSIPILKGIPFDTLEKSNHIKLNIHFKKSNRGKEFKSITLLPEMRGLKFLNNDHFVFLGFNRVVFNKERDRGFYTIDLSCSYNAGVEYTALAMKENDNWTLVRISETAIR